MYGFKNSECKINGCHLLVWPSKTMGYCNLHYQRYKTGRMDDVGNLSAMPIKSKKCESCGVTFELAPRERHVKWCKECRPKTYDQLRTDNNHGIYMRKRTRDKHYIASLLDVFIKMRGRKRKTSERNQSIVGLREQGKTYKDIGFEFHISKQRVQQICTKAVMI